MKHLWSSPGVVGGAALLLALFLLAGCGSFDKQVQDTATTRDEARALKAEIEQLQGVVPEIADHLARTGEWVERARQQIDMLRQSDPTLNTLLADPSNSLAEADQEIRDARTRFPEVAERVRAIHQRSTMTLGAAERAYGGAVDLRNQASLFRNVAGLLGIRMPEGAAQQPDQENSNSGTSLATLLFGTTGTLGGLGTAGYALYRATSGRRERRKEEEEEKKRNMTAAPPTFTVAAPPPSPYVPPQWPGYARSGAPPPGAGAGQPVGYGYVPPHSAWNAAVPPPPWPVMQQPLPQTPLPPAGTPMPVPQQNGAAPIPTGPQGQPMPQPFSRTLVAAPNSPHVMGPPDNWGHSQG